MNLQLPEPDPAQAQGGPLPAGLGGGGYDQDQQEDPLQVLQKCIQQLPRVIHALPDPKDVEDAVSALKILASIQTRLMKQGPGAPPQGQ
jgi:hypothetical protein